METFFFIQEQNGEPVINYYDLGDLQLEFSFPQPSISGRDSRLLRNKMFGEFIKTHNIQEENFEIPEACAICMSTPEEMERQLYLKTPCNHVFCAECVSRVLLNNSSSCSLCRSDIKNFSDFHYRGDLNDPPEQSNDDTYEFYYTLEDTDTESENLISQEEYDQTLYELLVEYWTTILTSAA